MIEAVSIPGTSVNLYEKRGTTTQKTEDNRVRLIYQSSLYTDIWLPQELITRR